MALDVCVYKPYEPSNFVLLYSHTSLPTLLPTVISTSKQRNYQGRQPISHYDRTAQSRKFDTDDDNDDKKKKRSAF